MTATDTPTADTSSTAPRPALDALLTAARHLLGAEHVLTGEDTAAHRDPYSFAVGGGADAAAVLLPERVDQVQELLRLANAHAVAVWTVSTGRNYGYGGAAPQVPGSVVLDLHRLDRVLEVDEECGYALVEPGVTFLALDAHLRAHAPGLMASVPDIGWGSVVGNALERGFGYTPHGDHSAFACGLEVVLADGSLVRTGMGAMTDSPVWSSYKGGYGPSVDGLFFQSNLGVVTKMGVWLMPRPAQVAACMITTASDDALAALVDTLRPLLLDGTIQSNVVVGNAPVIASMVSPRAAWQREDGPLTPEALAAMTAALGVGAWNARFGLYGEPGVVAARRAVVEAAVTRVPGAEVSVRVYAGDVDPADVHPADRAQLGIPGTDLVRMAAWRGGDPAHTDFSLVCPSTGRHAVAQRDLIRAQVQAHGFDYAGGFTLFPRHAIALALVSFDRSDPADTDRVRRLFPALVRDAAAQGYAPYRAHVEFMDLVAEQYDFGDGALRGLVQRLKGALDPNGVLAPGKQGVWPLAG